MPLEKHFGRPGPMGNFRASKFLPVGPFMQAPGLRPPVVAGDALGKIETQPKGLHRGIGPVGDLAEGKDALIIKLLRQNRSNPLDFRELVDLLRRRAVEKAEVGVLEGDSVGCGGPHLGGRGLRAAGLGVAGMFEGVLGRNQLPRKVLGLVLGRLKAAGDLLPLLMVAGDTLLGPGQILATNGQLTGGLVELPWALDGTDPNIPLTSQLKSKFLQSNGLLILGAIDRTIVNWTRMNSKDRTLFITQADSMRIYGQYQQILGFIDMYLGDENRIDVAQLLPSEEPQGITASPNLKGESVNAQPGSA